MSDEGRSSDADSLRGGDGHPLALLPTVRALVEAATRAGITLDGVWVVGGAVRDAIMGLPPARDIDLAVEGDAPGFARLLTAALAGEVISEHAFGTAQAVVDLGPEIGRVRVDIASCRTETYPEPGALPSVTLGAAIANDLDRRDFAANAVAMPLVPGPDGQHELVDPHHGVGDVVRRVLRVLHDSSFIDDPTRVLRLARYAGRLLFRVDDDTRSLAVAAVEKGAMRTISAERMRAELTLILREPAWDALTLLSSWGVLDQLDPRLEEVFRAPYLLRSIDAACGDDIELHTRAAPLRLTALVRPLGADAPAWLRWLGFSTDEITHVEDHLRVLAMVLDRTDELRAIRNSELYIEIGEVSDESFALAALAAGDNDQPLHARLNEYRSALREVQLEIRGEDVIAAGVPAGPAVGRILGDLFLRSLDRELVSAADARRALAEHAERIHGER